MKLRDFTIVVGSNAMLLFPDEDSTKSIVIPVPDAGFLRGVRLAVDESYRSHPYDADLYIEDESGVTSKVRSGDLNDPMVGLYLIQ